VCIVARDDNGLFLPAFTRLRRAGPRAEFRRLDAEAHVYLDYAGAALYPDTLVREHQRMLRRRILGNPHSTNPAALASTADARHAKEQLLRFFRADPAVYDVCFTANASGAIRLVGEAFAFDAGSRLVLTADNHNSVNGLRQFARARGAQVHYLPLDEELRVREFVLPPARARHNLFAFPAQSNFSGVRHPLAWVGHAREQGYHVLLDAAAFAPTSALDLSVAPADFVCVSLYKMIGYPTGLGALIAKREGLSALQRPWFSGGTVDFASVLTDRVQLKADAEAFEDGTINFLAVSAVPLGLALLERLGMARINAHVGRITQQLIEGLAGLRYSNGAPVVELYGPRDTQARGGTVAFNVRGPSGGIIDFESVIEAAAELNISLRGGCFCNPGASEHAFGYTAQQIDRALAQVSTDFSYSALRRCLGNRPVGAVRASLGYASTERDVLALLAFLSSFPTNTRSFS
jgi:selenocysteine lyase/cysteine desulfurase